MVYLWSRCRCRCRKSWRNRGAWWDGACWFGLPRIAADLSSHVIHAKNKKELCTLHSKLDNYQWYKTWRAVYLTKMVLYCAPDTLIKVRHQWSYIARKYNIFHPDFYHIAILNTWAYTLTLTPPLRSRSFTCRVPFVTDYTGKNNLLYMAKFYKKSRFPIKTAYFWQHWDFYSFRCFEFLKRSKLIN